MTFCSDSILVLDSGMGGVPLLNILVKKFPFESFIYYGDTLHHPYGHKSEKQLLSIVLRNINFLKKNHSIKLIIFACHTLSVTVLPILQKELSIPIYGMLKPTVDALVSKFDTGNIALLGTKNTISSKIYDRMIKTVAPSINLYSYVCPNLPSIIEKDKNISEKDLQENLELEPLNKCRGVILGCTHFSLIKGVFNGLLEPHVLLIEPYDKLTIDVEAYLKDHNLLALSNNQKITLLFSDNKSNIDLFDLKEEDLKTKIYS